MLLYCNNPICRHKLVIISTLTITLILSLILSLFVDEDLADLSGKPFLYIFVQD